MRWAVRSVCVSSCRRINSRSSNVERAIACAVWVAILGVNLDSQMLSAVIVLLADMSCPRQALF